jgi:hypothetical protein
MMGGISTLDPETHEKQWQTPTEYQTYEYDGEMYEIELGGWFRFVGFAGA